MLLVDADSDADVDALVDADSDADVDALVLADSDAEVDALVLADSDAEVDAPFPKIIKMAVPKNSVAYLTAHAKSIDRFSLIFFRQSLFYQFLSLLATDFLKEYRGKTLLF